MSKLTVKMMRAIHLCFVILFILTHTLFPANEDIRFERITVAQGLSHSTVYSIIQGSEGFIWIGTESGLNRYDGYNFKVFAHTPGDAKSLSSNPIRTIYEDQSKTLWIGTDEGLNRFDRERETFTCYKHDPDNKSSHRIRAIYEDRSGIMWIGTDAGLHEVDRDRESFTCYEKDSQTRRIKGYNIINAICEDRSGTLWIATAAGLLKFDREQKTFTCIKEGRIQSILEDRSGVIWIGTASCLSKFDREKGSFTLYKIGGIGDVYSIHEDKAGFLWIGTGQGFYKFDPWQGTHTRYTNDPLNSYSLSHNFVLSVCEDRSGVMWVGTRVGLNKFNRVRKEFVHYQHNPASANSLSHNHVWSILEDSSGILWIGTLNGLNKYERDKNRFTCYRHDPNKPETISHNCVYSIHEDRRGTIWVGTANGLDIVDRERGTFGHYKSERGNPDSLSSNVIMRIFSDRSGLIWVGTFSGGLNMFDPRQGRFTRYRHDSRDPANLSSDTVSSIYEDRAGVLWVGTYEGLNKFDREKEAFTRYKKDTREPRSLSSDKIESIYEDRSGILWIGTQGGLNTFDRETEVFTSYTEKYGLPHVIYGILEDDRGTLWLSSNKGIFTFNPATEELKSYDVTDGIQDYHFNDGAFFESKHGEMFFGGANGFNAFFPDKIKDNPYVPPVVITSFKVLNRPDYKTEKSILKTRALRLSYDDTFSFEFAALSFSEPRNNRYAYMLEGTHRDWIDLGNKREITFSNLAPRDYTLKVKGSNDDGVWNEQGSELKITILPPFWQTWWFRLLALSFIAVIFYFLYRLRVKDIEGRRAKLEARVKERTKELEQSNRFKSDFLARMSHEIRTPLNAILGFNEMLLDTRLDPEQFDYIQTAIRSGESLLALINDIVDLSRVEAGQLELDSIVFDPQAVALDVCELMQPLINAGSVEILCRIADSVPVYVKGDPARFRQVLVNLMENAVKFTEKGEIELALDVAEDRGTILTLHTTVKDSGIGIPADKITDIFEYFHQAGGFGPRGDRGYGLGLTICKQLSKLMGGDVWVESELGKGSTFHFTAAMEKSAEEAAKRMSPVPMPGKTAVTPDQNRRLIQILLAEDNLINQKLTTHLLIRAGYQLEVVKNGREAVIAYCTEPDKFDIILMDVQMPEMDGIEATRIIRDCGFTHIPIIAMTAQAMKGDREKCLQSGMNDYISKPIKKDMLFAMVQKWTRQETAHENP